MTYCISCHGQPALNPSLEYFRLDKYDMADAGGDLGVYEKRFEIYDEVITTGRMPKGTGAKPSEAEKAMLGEWILAGAPF